MQGKIPKNFLAFSSHLPPDTFEVVQKLILKDGTVEKKSELK